jgi:tetratricopeptide (TPR) repeat protein
VAFYRLRARCRRALKDEAAARDDDRHARQTSATTALDHFMQGQAAFHAGDRAGTVKHFQAALDLERTHYWALLWLGYSRLEFAQRPEDAALAVEDYTGCLLRRDRHALAYYLRARAYSALNKQAEAVKDYSRALELDPKEVRAWNDRGNAYWRLGQHEKAVADHTRTIELSPKLAEAWNNRGVAYTGLRQFDKTVADCSRAIELNPKFVEAWGNRGTAWNELGQYDKSVADLSRAVELNASYWPAWLRLGNSLRALKRYDEAVKAYVKAGRLKPDLPDASWGLNHIGNALADLGRLDEAIVAYKESIRLKADDAGLYNNLGKTLAARGRHEQAFVVFRKGLELDPKLAMMHNNFAIALQQKGLVDQAIAEYRKAIDLEPGNAMAHSNLAGVLESKGLVEEAMAEHKKAVRCAPEDAGVHYNFAIAYEHRGLLDEAAHELETAVRLRSDFPQFYFELGSVLRAQGRCTESLAAFRRWQEVGSRQPGWRQPSAAWVRETERLAALDDRLGLVLAGEAEPRDATERLALAKFCHEYKRIYATAARLCAEAFAAEPHRARDLRNSHRSNAARVAALAGCGKGADAAALAEAERARLRRQALDWLRADLADWSRLPTNIPAQVNATRQRLQRWLLESDFDGVRGPALKKLPAAEQEAWRRLWADIERTLRQLDGATPKD